MDKKPQPHPKLNVKKTNLRALTPEALRSIHGGGGHKMGPSSACQSVIAP